MAWLPSFNAQSCCAHLWWTMKAREINGKYYKKHATHRMFRGHSAGIFSFSTPMPTSFHSAHILYLNLLLYILKQISAPPPFFFVALFRWCFCFFLCCVWKGVWKWITSLEPLCLLLQLTGEIVESLDQNEWLSMTWHLPEIVNSFKATL